MVALVLASIFIVLERHGFLNWLDSITLRVVGTIELDSPDSKKLANADTPVSLLIGGEYFEIGFHQESPLNRYELTKLLNLIVKTHPSIIAVDIDLSPGPVGALLNTGQEALDEVLLKIALDDKIPIVLVSPFPVSTDSLVNLKHEWLLKMCTGGVRFALPYVVQSQGLALRYPYKAQTLGLVSNLILTSAANDKKKEGLNVPSIVKEESRDLCPLIREGPEKSIFLSKEFTASVYVKADDLSEQRPFNTEFLRYYQSVTRVLKAADLGQNSHELKNRPVFLGSQFDSRDEFMTSFGVLKGTVLHAAAFYSARNPTKMLTHTKALLLDLLFGITAGFLFGWLWKKANAAAKQLESIQTSFPVWLVTRAWQLSSFTCLVMWIGLLFLSSAWLLRYDSWNNPGPMIVGVFVKTILASRVNLIENSNNLINRNTRYFKFLKYLDWILLSPIIIWASIILLSH